MPPRISRILSASFPYAFSSARICSDGSPESLLRPPAVNCLQPELDLSRMFFKNDLIYLFLFTLIIFIVSLPIKNRIKYTETSCIVFDFIILLLGISFYIGLSLYTNFRLLKFYRFYSILFIQSFLVYPIIFILKKISLKCSKI